MASYIPFVNSQADCAVLTDLYTDADVCRVSLETIDGLMDFVPQHLSLWLDPSVDAYHWRLKTKWPDEPKSRWEQRPRKLWKKLDDLFARFSNYELLCKSRNWKQQNYESLAGFVQELLGYSNMYEPAWLTIPQLPLVDSGARNKINKMLAKATMAWKTNAGFEGKLILPLILTNQRQANSKSVRDNKLAQAVECFNQAGAEGIWVVDSTLTDQTRNRTYRNRYSKLIEFHKLLKDKLPQKTIKIGGPYWGLNLILWARGLCDYAAISLGSRYAYHISAGVPSPPSTRIAIPPLRRWVVMIDELRAWIDNSLDKFSADDQVYKGLKYLKQNFDLLKPREASKKYTAQFYKHWFDKIASCPPDGRALALYQDLSTAFVVGSQLPKLPKECLPNSASDIRKSGKVAEQLMLSCL